MENKNFRSVLRNLRQIWNESLKFCFTSSCPYESMVHRKTVHSFLWSRVVHWKQRGFVKGTSYTAHKAPYVKCTMEVIFFVCEQVSDRCLTILKKFFKLHERKIRGAKDLCFLFEFLDFDCANQTAVVAVKLIIMQAFTWRIWYHGLVQCLNPSIIAMTWRKKRRWKYYHWAASVWGIEYVIVT